MLVFIFSLHVLFYKHTVHTGVHVFLLECERFKKNEWNEVHSSCIITPFFLPFFSYLISLLLSFSSFSFFLRHLIRGHVPPPPPHSYNYHWCDLSHANPLWQIIFFPFSFSSFTPDNVPKHRDSGFLRVNIGTNHVAFVSAQNVGKWSLEVELNVGWVKYEDKLYCASLVSSGTSRQDSPAVIHQAS